MSFDGRKVITTPTPKEPHIANSDEPNYTTHGVSRNNGKAASSGYFSQLQLHGGKNSVVLYQEMKLQFELHVSIEPAAASLQWFNWSGSPPRTRIIEKEHVVHVQGVP